ncbi:hypothetical protein DA718_29600 (plasmid) [Klebsiella huaxiensis]|uniref:hypothetical protein n=1 Tax=Klebsiella huaxiensis TaxID=2153354 RepID=UPI00102EF32D|nr:hypothetical protein [Klebsiella huaxiensis]QBG11269.1 hypothetical protein DA718_29600 [Klebsiella huaxiensis]
MTEPVTPIPDSEEGPVTFVDSALKAKPPQPAISGRYRRSHRDGERWLWTVVVFFSAVILLATISGQAVKNGDVAACVSMLFNGVMATAAVGAYLTARKWVPQLTTQEGYKVAICLVNEHYIYLGIQNPLLRSTNQALSCYNEFLQIYNHTSSADYARKIAILSRAILNEKERKDSIEQADFRLRTYGLYVSPAYSDSMNAMKDAFTHSIDAACSLEAMLQSDLILQKKLEGLDSTSVQFVSDMERLLGAREHLKVTILADGERLSQKWNEMVALQGAIFNTHPRIGELFSVRN